MCIVTLNFETLVPEYLFPGKSLAVSDKLKIWKINNRRMHNEHMGVWSQ